MSLGASGHDACCGGATGRWSIWREVMQNGSLPPKVCWLICPRTKRRISWAATRRASICRAGDDGRPKGDDALLARARGQTAYNVALEENSDNHERSDGRGRQRRHRPPVDTLLAGLAGH